jgi:hypothetical protein
MQRAQASARGTDGSRTQTARTSPVAVGPGVARQARRSPCRPTLWGRVARYRPHNRRQANRTGHCPNWPYSVIPHMSSRRLSPQLTWPPLAPSDSRCLPASFISLNTPPPRPLPRPSPAPSPPSPCFWEWSKNHFRARTCSYPFSLLNPPIPSLLYCYHHNNAQSLSATLPRHVPPSRFAHENVSHTPAPAEPE